MTKKCTRCKTDKQFVDFYKATAGKLGLSSRCKTCEKIYQQTRKLEKHESHKKWWNSEKGIEYKTQKRNQTKQSRLDDLVKKIEIFNKTDQNSVDAWRSGYFKRNFAKLNATPKWVDKYHKEKITKIYAITQQLQEATGSVYHVDHIVPLVSSSVCGLHVWWNLQPLPEKTNVTKNNIFNPAIYPEQGEVAFPRWGRINAVQQLQHMETSDE